MWKVRKVAAVVGSNVGYIKIPCDHSYPVNILRKVPDRKEGLDWQPSGVEFEKGGSC